MLSEQLRAFRAALIPHGVPVSEDDSGPLGEQLARLRQVVVGEIAARTPPARDPTVREPTAGESERWLRSLFELPSVGVVSVDVQTRRFLNVNERYCRITGYTRDELLARTVIEITHPEDRPTARERFQRMVDGVDADYEEEKRYLRKDGRIVWVCVSARVLPASDGDRARTLGIVTDVTERTQAEAALRETQECFRRAVDDSPFPKLIHAEDGTVLTVNAAWTALSGYRREDIPHLDQWAARAHGTRTEAVLAHVDTLYQLDRTVAEGDRVIRTRGGEERVWDFYSVPLGRDADGRRLVLRSAADVTEQKRAERALRDSSERFGALADNVSQLAWMADETGSISWYNKRWYEYTGTTLPEMEGWGWQAVHHPDHVERVKRKFTDAVREGVPWEDTFPLRSRDGEWRWFLSRAVPIRGVDGHVRWFGTNTDVTPLLSAEAELRHANETLEERVRARTAALEDANAELESFSYSVAHDLRAPLRAIEGFSTLLRGGPSVAESRVYIDRIGASVRRMSQLIEDLMGLSRIGRVELRREEVDLPELVANVVAELRQREPGRRVEVTVELTERCVVADPAFLRILLVNLLGNAWKFTQGRDPARITFGSFTVAGGAAWFVRDNGVGFDMAHAHQLFRPFQRLHSPDAFPGTGIGLAIVARIVARHGGRVWAEATADGGATFYFTLGPEAGCAPPS